AATLEADAESGASASLWWDAAQSWRAANDPERAVQALRRCAQHALEIGRPGEAAQLLNEAARLPQPLESLRIVSEGLIRSAMAAGDVHLVLHAAALRRTSINSDLHDDLEIAVLRSGIRAQLSSTAVEQLLRCAYSEEASPLHRVEAGL